MPGDTCRPGVMRCTPLPLSEVAWCGQNIDELIYFHEYGICWDTCKTHSVKDLKTRSFGAPGALLDEAPESILRLMF